MKLKTKEQITISNKNDSFVIKQKNETTKEFKATLKWKTAVDLDLYCMYRLKGQSSESTGFFAKLSNILNGEANDSNEGTIYYGRKGNANSKPYIRLDQDSGVGDTGGDNEENMVFHDMSKIESAIIVANIYAKNTSFAKYNGSVTVQNADTVFTVPLTEKKNGSWCVVAKIDNRTNETILTNVNKTMSNKPQLKDFI